jgi:SOS response regulatory protein OraA/RecX
MFVSAYGGRKSRRQMEQALLQKGIHRDLIQCYFEENEYSEEDSLKRQFVRYIQGKDLQDWKIRQRVYGYFYRKGFAGSEIEAMIHRQLEGSREN